MAGFQNRKSTAPPPPPLSQLWQIQTTTPHSYSNSDNDVQSVSTTHEIMNDDEMNKMLIRNGHPTSQSQRKSITKKYNVPKPPLHATHAIISEKPDNHMDSIIKNNPYSPYRKNKQKRRILTKNKKRTIRPVNASLSNHNNNNNNLLNNNNNNNLPSRPSYYNNKTANSTNINNNINYKHTITDMDHHRKESKSIDIFLRNRMSEKELQNRRILPNNIESNQSVNTKEFWEGKKQQRDKIRNKLTQRLSKSFRPQVEELYDRGIYVTDPKEPEHAAWNHANMRRRNSRSLESKFNKRPLPKEVLNKGYIHEDDYKELFDDKYRPQTQPPTPTFDNNNNNDIDNMNTIYEEKKNIDVNKLNNKIKQRPTVNEMKSRGMIYEDPAIPASLSKRKRELHRRRASRKLEEFLLKRPKVDVLKKRHIFISQKERELEEKIQLKTRQKLYSHIDKERKRRKKKGKIWITQGKVLESKRRESIKISDFLLSRPKAEKLVKKHILPSMPYSGGYDEIRNDFSKGYENKRKIIDKLFSKPYRADFNELERRGYLPSEYITGNHVNHDYDKAQFDLKRRRKQSRTDLEKLLGNRQPMKQLIHNHIIDPNMNNVDDIKMYHQRRLSQKMDFRNNLNAKFESRPEIDQVPYKYFMPQNSNDDEKVIDPSTLNLDIENSNNNNGKRGIKRKRIEKTAISRASLVLEQFLPVRPEIQQLWDKNILPSLPPSPHKIQTFNYQKGKKDANSEYQNLFGFDTLQHTPSPLQQPERNINNMSSKPRPIKPNSIHSRTTDEKTTDGGSSVYSPITPQTLYIDKRRNRRQDSMAQLELKLLDRAPRESLFELGILIMSPAPSPPPLSIIKQTQKSKPDKPDMKSIFDNKENDEAMYNNYNDINNQSRKRRKLMNGMHSKEKNDRNKRSSLVLDEFLGKNIADKLDEHLYNRPDPIDLINRGIVPTYSFAKKSIYDTPSKFAKHRRNMTLELQHKLEHKLKNRPLLNDLPKKIYSINANLKQLYENNKISFSEQSEIQSILSSMRESHVRDLEDLKGRHWSLLIEEKDRYKQLERVNNRTEITIRQKLEAMQAQCQQLSTLLITKNTQLKDKDTEFKQRLIRLQQEHQQQYQRQEARLKLSNDNQRELRQEMERQNTNNMQSTNNHSMQSTNNTNNHSMESPKLIDINFLFENIIISDSDLEIISSKIVKIETKYASDLQRERSMHRKFNEQSERVKQTLVDEINKMELQHQSKLHNLENQIVLLKEENRSLKQNNEMEVKKLKAKLSSEIDKERNIATIMVEDLDEEKTRLIQEMEEIKKEYDKKLKIQKEQIDQLRQVAEDAVFYGNKAVNSNNIDITKNIKYKQLKKSKQNLEKQVLFLTQQILNTFKNNLNSNILKELNLENINQ